jgi:hypothetical protein
MDLKIEEDDPNGQGVTKFNIKIQLNNFRCEANS